MARQGIHIRHSKYGRKFVAGRRPSEVISYMKESLRKGDIVIHKHPDGGILYKRRVI